MKQEQSRQSPNESKANLEGHPLSINNPYISSVLRRSSQMSPGGSQKRSLSNIKSFNQPKTNMESNSLQRLIHDENEVRDGHKIPNSLGQKRSSAQPSSIYQQNQVKSATGGPDQFDEKSGSRLQSNDDETSHNTVLQKEGQANSRSRQSRQSRQSAAKERKAHLTERIKSAGGTGASSSLNQNFTKEKRRVLPNTDSMTRSLFGQLLVCIINQVDTTSNKSKTPQLNASKLIYCQSYQKQRSPPIQYDGGLCLGHSPNKGTSIYFYCTRPSVQKLNGVQSLKYGQIDSRSKNYLKDKQNKNVNGSFKMNEFNLDMSPGKYTNDASYPSSQKVNQLSNLGPYQDNESSLDQSKDNSEILIDPNPFARRDKSKRSNNKSARDKKKQVKIGAYDESSSNQVETQSNEIINKTPSLPNMSAVQSSHFSFEQGNRPAFRVENDEHNITNISLQVSQMNITGDAAVIEEIDEGDTFRPNPQILEDQMTKHEPNSFQHNFKSKFKLEHNQSSQMLNLGSGRNRPNKHFNSQSENLSAQKQLHSTSNFGRINQSNNQNAGITRSPNNNYNFPRQYQKPKTSVTTGGTASPNKDSYVIYRAVDQNRKLIEFDASKDTKKNMPHNESEFTSSNPNKIDQLMKPVRQQQSVQTNSSRLVSPSKSQKQRFSHLQANQKENRLLNDSSHHSQSVSSHILAQRIQDEQLKTQGSESNIRQNYNSKHNFTSNLKEQWQIYHTSDDRNKRSNLSIGSIPDANDITAFKDNLTQIKEETNFNDFIAKQNADETNTQKLDYDENSYNQYEEEPEAEAKTQLTLNQRLSKQVEYGSKTTQQRQRKSQANLTTNGQISQGKNMVGKGSPRLTSDKKQVLNPLVNNVNNSPKKGLTKQGSQSTMMQTGSFKKEDAKNEADSKIQTLSQQKLISQRQQLTAQQADDNQLNQSLISHNSTFNQRKSDLKNYMKLERSLNDSKLATEQSPQLAKGHFKSERDIEIENLKTVIVALNQKIKAKEDVEKQFKELKKHQQSVIEGRDELRVQIEENVSSFRDQQTKNQKFQELIIEENKNWNLVDQEKDQIISAKDNEIRELRALLNQKDRYIQDLKIETEELNSSLQQNNQINSFYNKIQEFRAKNNQEIQNIFEQHNQQIQKEYDERQALIRQKEEMQQQIRILQQENDELTLKNDQFKLHADQNRNKEKLELQLQQVKESQDYVASLENQLVLEKMQREDLKDKMKQIQSKNEDFRNDDHQNFQAIQAEISRVTQEKEEAVQQSADKDIKIKNLMQTNLELQAKLHQLNQLVAIKDDLTDQLDQLNNYVEEVLAQKKTMQRELDTAGDYLLEQEEKTNQANLTALDLLNKLKEADEEIENLKRLINQLKSQVSQYVPVQGDATDEALADFINNFHDKSKLKVMFIRLNPGIYQFGSKKICIRVEQGKIHIRVGGGYLYIEEFLEQYTTLELEKAIREGIDPMGGDQSPMRVPALEKTNRSPTGHQRSISPKKLLHKVSASPVPGTNQSQWKPQNFSPRKTDRMFQ